MKKINLIYILLISAFASCKVDETIYDQATPDNAIKRPSDITNLMTGVYSHLNTPPGFGRDILWSLHPYADDISSTVTFEQGIWGRKLTINSGTPFVNTIYVNFYLTIRDANGVIDAVEKITLDPVFKARTKGDALFIRAFSYFNLVQLYGGVPLTIASVNAGSDFYQPRNTVDQVYSQIFSDLQEAVNSLPTRTDQPATEFYRATKGAAQGYLAKAYLTYANYLDLHNRSQESRSFYEKAKIAADAIINSGQYSLISDYGALFDVNKEKANYAEVMFAIPHTRDGSDISLFGEGTYLPGTFLPTTYPNSTGTNTKAGNGFMRIQPWFFERYTKGDFVNDYRVERTFLSKWNDATNKRHVSYPLAFVAADTRETSSYLFKYVDGAGLSTNGHENDFYLLRYSEVYLIKAEAENELNGPSAEALTAFNAVRARARLANGVARTAPANVTNGVSKEDFRMKIFDERGLEFVGEFNRFFDLIRMRYTDNKRTMYEYQFGTFLPSLVPGLPKNSAGIWQGGGVTEATNIIPFNAKYLLLPMPANQIAVNTKLTQNPGW
ncbi:RagB/SusD family nutrient uptake outer membrane protein [Pedobacter miscanthi]|uniref:RagB/SusD family nutrient uptake outer membrane protein n=1 Tax=Pedobacter miscanthi TaxID=2259170 RepID=UPI0029316155|nr:RagB/SusD family nutrient uptake outer membrane protein [Pedobacter miscanthi]